MSGNPERHGATSPPSTAPRTTAGAISGDDTAAPTMPPQTSRIVESTLPSMSQPNLPPQVSQFEEEVVGSITRIEGDPELYPDQSRPVRRDSEGSQSTTFSALLRRVAAEDSPSTSPGSGWGTASDGGSTAPASPGQRESALQPSGESTIVGGSEGQHPPDRVSAPTKAHTTSVPASQSSSSEDGADVRYPSEGARRAARPDSLGTRTSQWRRNQVNTRHANPTAPSTESVSREESNGPERLDVQAWVQQVGSPDREPEAHPVEGVESDGKDVG